MNHLSQQSSIMKTLAEQAQSIDTKDDALEFVNKLHELGFKINIGMMD
jgi:hypothetical protein